MLQRFLLLPENLAPRGEDTDVPAGAVTPAVASISDSLRGGLVGLIWSGRWRPHHLGFLWRSSELPQPHLDNEQAPATFAVQVALSCII